MKKLLLSIALFASLSASAQKTNWNPKELHKKQIVNSSNDLVMRYNDSELNIIRSESVQHSLIADNNGAIVKVYDPLFENVKLERVSYRNEKYGGSIEQSKEIEFRKATLAKYKKLGYAFDGMVTGANGKFMKFVK